jgi:hypothetical protein
MRDPRLHNPKALLGYHVDLMKPRDEAMRRHLQRRHRSYEIQACWMIGYGGLVLAPQTTLPME